MWLAGLGIEIRLLFKGGTQVREESRRVFAAIDQETGQSKTAAACFSVVQSDV